MDIDIEGKARAINQDLLAGVMAAASLPMAFYGSSLWNYMVVVIGFLLGGYLTYGLLCEYGDQIGVDEQLTLWLSIGIGVALGVILVYLQKCAIFLFGAIGFTILGNIIYATIAIQLNWDNDYVHGGAIILCAIIGGCLMLWIFKQLLKAVTAFVGGYMAASAMSYFIDRYALREDTSFVDVLQFFGDYDNIHQCSDTCTACLVTWGVVFVFGLWFQIRGERRRRANDPVRISLMERRGEYVYAKRLK